jgi:hypothetical protein
MAMRLLLHDELPDVPLERVFRHNRAAGFVMLLLVGAPAVLAALNARAIGATLRELPGLFWILGTLPALLASLVWLLVLQAASHSMQAGLLATNWVLRVSAAGIGVQLRSYRNTHFRRDVSTVLWLETREVLCARRVTESGWISNAHNRVFVRKNWLELELRDAACAPLEQRLAEERAEQGPQIRVLGIRTRTRFDEQPVFVTRPGVLRVEWLGRGMLEALREVVAVAEDVELDLDQALGTDLEPRVRALCARGMQFSAYELLRRERGMSLPAAKRHVEELARKAA